MSGFPGLTLHRILDAFVSSPRLWREEAARREAARALLAFVGCAGDVNARANSLPFGHQRVVEIARALALDSRAPGHGRASGRAQSKRSRCA